MGLRLKSINQKRNRQRSDQTLIKAFDISCGLLAEKNGESRSDLPSPIIRILLGDRFTVRHLEGPDPSESKPARGNR
jgi:hypothetical protein